MQQSQEEKKKQIHINIEEEVVAENVIVQQPKMQSSMDKLKT